MQVSRPPLIFNAEAERHISGTVTRSLQLEPISGTVTRHMECRCLQSCRIDTAVGAVRFSQQLLFRLPLCCSLHLWKMPLFRQKEN